MSFILVTKDWSSDYCDPCKTLSQSEDKESHSDEEKTELSLWMLQNIPFLVIFKPIEPHVL